MPVLAVAWLVSILAHQPLSATDFRYVWLAGHLWSHGISPYGQAYLSAGARLFPDGNGISVWVYPFQWYLPTRLLALLDPEPALRVWLLFSLCLAGVSAALMIRAAALLGLRLRWWALRLGLGYAATVTALSALLRLGQPAVVALAGVAFIVYGLADRRRAPLVLGVVLATFKPQLGLPFIAALLLMPGGFVACLLAAPIVAALSIPAFISIGVAEQVSGLIANIAGGYDVVPVNQPINLAGLPHLLAATMRIELPRPISLAIAIALTLTVVAAARRLFPAGSNQHIATYAVAATLATTTITGLHTYDLCLLLLILPLAPLLGGAARLPVLFGYLLLWRPENLVRLIGDERTLMPSVTTAAVLLIALGWVWHALAGWRQRRPQSSADALPGAGSAR